MTMAAQTLLDRYLEFTKNSLNWCSNEAENATVQVSDAIEKLLTTAARVSELSEESILAIKDLQEKIENHKKVGGASESLIHSLKEISISDDGTRNIIHPIIETLQFQDRLRQNLENMVRMIPKWIEARQNFPEDSSKENLIEFGEALMKCTTMKEERDCIRHHIEGLKEEETQKDPIMMF